MAFLKTLPYRSSNQKDERQSLTRNYQPHFSLEVAPLGSGFIITSVTMCAGNSAGNELCQYVKVAKYDPHLLTAKPTNISQARRLLIGIYTECRPRCTVHTQVDNLPKTSH